MAAQQHDLQPSSARYLLEVIAGYTNGHPAFPSYDTLARRTGLSADLVRKYVKRLVDAGYLALSRRSTGRAGWDAPQWALGPLCNVGTSAHFEPDQVVTGAQLKRAPVPTQSGHQRPQKRESSTTAAAVGVSNGGGLNGSVVKREGEESPPTPQPAKKVGNARVQALIDALRAGGHPAIAAALTPADFQATAKGDFEPEQMARCMIDLATGTDEWIKERFGVAMILRFRYSGWQVKHATPVTHSTTTNGRPSRIERQRALMDKMRAEAAREEPARDLRSVRPALPAPGDAL